VFASAIKLLTHFHLPHSPEENLQTVWVAIKDAYKACSHNMMNLCLLSCYGLIPTNKS